MIYVTLTLLMAFVTYKDPTSDHDGADSLMADGLSREAIIVLIVPSSKATCVQGQRNPSKCRICSPRRGLQPWYHVIVWSYSTKTDVNFEVHFLLTLRKLMYIYRLCGHMRKVKMLLCGLVRGFQTNRRVNLHVYLPFVLRCRNDIIFLDRKVDKVENNEFCRSLNTDLNWHSVHLIFGILWRKGITRYRNLLPKSTNLRENWTKTIFGHITHEQWKRNTQMYTNISRIYWIYVHRGFLVI